jgi:hypothetical protein
VILLCLIEIKSIYLWHALESVTETEQLLLLLLLVFSPWASLGRNQSHGQATGMALVRCILGKFLGVVCHCFPPEQL